MKVTGKILHTLFCILFLAFTGLILHESNVKILKLAQGNRVRLFAALTVCGLLLFYLLLRKVRFHAWPLAAVSIGFSVAARALALRFIGMHMTMRYDYLTALESARGVFASKEAIFTHWGFYPRLLSVWMKLFGDSYNAAVWFNIATCAVSVLLVFLIAQKLWQKPLTSFTAAILFGLWPSYVLYTCITSNEHLAILFMLLAAYLMLLAWKRQDKFRWLLTLLAGISAGCADCFKEFSPVFTIAVFATGFVLWLVIGRKAVKENDTVSTAALNAAAENNMANTANPNAAAENNMANTANPNAVIENDNTADTAGSNAAKPASGEESPCRNDKPDAKTSGTHPLRRFAVLLLTTVLVFASASVTHKAALKYLENYLGQPVCKGATAHFLWIGLNSQSGGMWSSETGMKVYELAEEYDNDYDKVMSSLWTLLAEDLKAHPESLRATVQHKMEVDWAADSGVVDWVVALYEENALPHKDLIYAVCAGFYTGVIIMTALGTLLEATFLWQGEHDFAGPMYLRLVPFGYGLLLLLSEAQGRYQLVLFPCFALLAAEMLHFFSESLMKGAITIAAIKGEEQALQRAQETQRSQETLKS